MAANRLKSKLMMYFIGFKSRHCQPYLVSRDRPKFNEPFTTPFGSLMVRGGRDARESQSGMDSKSAEKSWKCVFLGSHSHFVSRIVSRIQIEAIPRITSNVLALF